jgi:hypothetical protein
MSAGLVHRISRIRSRRPTIGDTIGFVKSKEGAHVTPAEQMPTLQSFDDFYRSLGTATHHDFPANKLLALADSIVHFDAKRLHLLKLYEGVSVAHSFVDDSGQIFDCVPIDRQPALIKSGQSLAQPPSFPGGASPAKTAAAFVLDGSRTDRLGNRMACPPGTVPIRRVTLEELSRFDDLQHFLRKGPRSDRRSGAQLLVSPHAQSANTPHQYAHAYQSVANSGGHGFVNVWTPTVTGNQIFSLSQHWYVANGTAGLQTAEVGWQVYPQKYGHANPVLFTFWTADGYVNTGSYNSDAGDFVQYSANCPVGVALTTTSVSGGNQAEIELSFVLADGNWWLFVDGTDNAHAIGYYPTALYQGGPMATGATEIDFGGETVGTGAYPPMGSGAFAALGYRKAAYHRNITYFPNTAGVQDAALTICQDWPSSYTIDLEKSAEWGQYFFFGGPGSAAPVAAPAAATLASVAGAAPVAAMAPTAPSVALGVGANSPLREGARLLLAAVRTKRNWALLTLLFIGALIGFGQWIVADADAHQTGNVRTQWVCIEATLLGLCVVAGYIVNGRPDGLLIDEENRISLTRVQWAAWLIVLLGGFFVEAIWNVAVGFNDPANGPFPFMQSQLYALLGIVSGSAVVGGVIVNGKMNAPNAPPPPDNAAIGTPTNVGLVDSNVDACEASWADLYLGDEVANRDVVDISRLQKLIVTVLLIMTYVQLLWFHLVVDLHPAKTAGLLPDAHFANMPQVGDSFIWLLGISHGAYLAYKAVPKTQTASPTPAALPSP